MYPKFTVEPLYFQVMDAGQLKEFDEPYILLQDSSSLLSKFAAKTKGGQLEVLKSLAEEVCTL